MRAAVLMEDEGRCLRMLQGKQCCAEIDIKASLLTALT